MKNFLTIPRALAGLLLFWMLALASCTKDNEEDPGPGTGTGEPDDLINTDVDPDLVTSSLRFENGSLISGNLPAFTQMADLKIDTDTIFWVQGIKQRIKIKKPMHVAIGSFWAQVEGSDSYIKADFIKKEETDTVAVFYFDFDLNGADLQPPFSFNLNFVAADEFGTSIDAFDIPVAIEESPGDNENNRIQGYLWEWISTTANGELVGAPMNPRITESTVKGCCIEGKSVYSGAGSVCPFDQHISLNYTAVFVINYEYLRFDDSQKLIGELLQQTQNLDVGGSDFCAGSTGYFNSFVGNLYQGEYSYNADNNTLKISSLTGESEPIKDDDGNYYGEWPMPIYAGSGPGVTYTFLSEHIMKETVNRAGVERIYVARSSEFEWLD